MIGLGCYGTRYKNSLLEDHIYFFSSGLFARWAKVLVRRPVATKPTVLGNEKLENAQPQQKYNKTAKDSGHLSRSCDR